MQTDQLAHNLASNVITIRQHEQLSQAQLAARAEIPRSTLANMESGAGNPSLSNLAKVASALRVTIEELLAKPRTACLLQKAGSISPLKRAAGQALIYKLMPESVRGMEIDRMELSPGATIRGTPHIAGTKEYLYVLEGKIRMLVSGEIYQLCPHDLLAFPGNQAHSYNNHSDQPSVGLSVVVPVPIENR